MQGFKELKFNSFISLWDIATKQKSTLLSGEEIKFPHSNKYLSRIRNY